MRVSVCYITKNAEKYLNESITSIKPIADEIIVIDDCSTDSTRDICKKHDAEVVVRKFNGDKATQRNEYLKRATGDWILAVDADEVYKKDELVNLKRHMKDDVVTIRYPFYTFWKDYKHLIRGHMWDKKYERCFKNLKGLKYDIHHMVSDSKGRLLNGCPYYRDKIKHVDDVHVYHYSMMPPHEDMVDKITYYMLRDNPNVNKGNVLDYVARHPYFSGILNQPRYGEEGLYVAGTHKGYEEKVVEFNGKHPIPMRTKLLDDHIKSANKYMEEHWQYHNHLDHDRHQARLKMTADYCKGKTLEVGCANGFSTKCMQEYNPKCEFEGVEPTDWGYSQAMKNYPDMNFYKELGEMLPFKDGCYDTVLLGEIIEHVPFPRMLADEAWRVASKRLIITTPTQMHPDPDHKRYYSIEDMKKFLEPYGKAWFVGLTEDGKKAKHTGDIYFQIAVVDK